MSEKAKRQTYAILPGSYDPITVGHLDIIRRASKLFDRVYVAVMINAKKNYTFDIYTRYKMAQEACANIENATVVSDTGYLVKLAERLGCQVIVKGIRSLTDFEYESEMAKINHSMSPDIETIFLPCKEDYSEISSTAVKQAIANGEREKAEKMLPAPVCKIVFKK